MKTLTVLLVLLMATIGFAQPPDVLWMRVYQQDGSSGLTDVDIAPDGTCYVGGQCCTVWWYHNPTLWNYIARLQSNGDAAWSRSFWTFPDPASQVTSVKAMPDGCIAGLRAGFPNFTTLPLLLRLNSNGDTLWSFWSLHPGISAEVHSITRTSDGGVAILATDNLLARQLYQISGEGQLIGQRDMTITYCSDIIAFDGGYFVVGTSEGIPNDTIQVQKLDSRGNEVWTTTVFGLPSGPEWKLVLNREGSILLMGCVFEEGESRTLAKKLDWDGQYLWSNLYGPCSDHFSLDTCMGGGDILLTDRLIRINDNGETLWTREIPCEGCVMRGVAQTSDSGFIVVGSDGDSSVVIRFSREGLPADEHFILRPSAFTLSAYPNPFNPTTTLSFTLPKSGYVDLSVYDITGRLVCCLAGGHMGPHLQAGEHRIEFNGGNLPSGIYFARLQSGEFNATQKLLLLK